VDQGAEESPGGPDNEEKTQTLSTSDPPPPEGMDKNQLTSMSPNKNHGSMPASRCSSTTNDQSIRPDSVQSGSDDSMCSATRQSTVVSRYGLDVRGCLDRIRKVSDPAALFDTSTADDGRPGTPRTSLGMQLAGTKVINIIPCGPVSLSQGIFVGDDILRVDNKEVGRHNIAQLLTGSDTPGSTVFVQVRSAKTGNVVDVTVERGDVEEVKLHRNLSDWLAHIRDGTTTSSGIFAGPPGDANGMNAAAADHVMAILTSLQLRRKEQLAEIKERSHEMAENIRSALDDIYMAVGKMEGAYNSVHKRARRLLQEVERANLLAGVRAASGASNPGGLASGDAHDVKMHELRMLVAAQAMEIKQLKGTPMGSGEQSVADMNPSHASSTPPTPTSSARASVPSHDPELFLGNLCRESLGRDSADPLPHLNAGLLVQKLMQLEDENRRLRHDLSTASHHQHQTPLREEYKGGAEPESVSDFLDATGIMSQLQDVRVGAQEPPRLDDDGVEDGWPHPSSAQGLGSSHAPAPVSYANRPHAITVATTSNLVVDEMIM
jgi:hypothetical protein